MSQKPVDGLLQAQSAEETSRRAKTQEYIERGYAYGLAYEQPPLYVNGIYTYCNKPPSFDNQSTVRAAVPAEHTDVMRCSVSGRFVNEAVFEDANILLEILQNAESSDSKGPWFGLEFFAEGKWRTVTEEINDFTDEQIQVVRVADYGKGYLPTDLTTVGGGKRSDKTSAGQFGTGMKVSDRSALGKGVLVTRSSRNWRAVPFLETVLTSTGPDQTVSYNVEFLGENYRGSVVEYRNLTAGMMTALRNIGDYYLPLDDTLQDRLLAQNEYGLVLTPKKGTGDIMVKGRKYTLTVETDQPRLFSYDLHNCTIDDQNRHFVDTSQVTQNIRSILFEITDEKIWRHLLDSKPEFYEHTLRGFPSIPEGLKLAIINKYGITDWSKAYVQNEKTLEENKAALDRKGYVGIPVEHSRLISETLFNDGMRTGDNYVDRITRSRLGADDPSEFFDERFNSCACRAIDLLEGTDIEGEVKEVVIVLETQKGEKQEVSFETYLANLEDYKKVKLVKLAVRFPNMQYTTNSSRNPYLESWFSDRIFSPFLAAIQGAGVRCMVSNGYQEVEPVKYEGKSRSVLNVRTWPENTEPLCLQIEIYPDGVGTGRDLAKLREYSLNFQPNYQPILVTEYGDIVSLEEGNIYEKGLKRDKYDRKDHKYLFSYNIHDRVSGRPTDMKELPKYVGAIIAKADKPEIAKAVLLKAKEGVESRYVEYDFVSEYPAVWAQAFEEIFGESTVMEDCGKSVDFDLIKQVRDQSSMKTVTLNPALTKSLTVCGVKRLSNAVQGEKFTEYAPLPIEEALLRVKEVVETAIVENLPDGVAQIKPQLRVVQSILNCYGQEIAGESGYLNPFLTDQTVYLHDKIVSKGKFNQIIYSIMLKTLAMYRPYMSQEQYAELHAHARDAVDIAIEQGVKDEFKEKALLDRGKVLELVERMVELVKHPIVMDDEDLIDQRSVRRAPTVKKSPRTAPTQAPVARTAEGDIKPANGPLITALQGGLAEMKRKAAQRAASKPAKKVRRGEQQQRQRQGDEGAATERVPRRGVGKVAATLFATAAAVLAVLAVSNNDTVSDGFERFGRAVSPYVPDIPKSWLPDNPTEVSQTVHEFVRRNYGEKSQIGVSIDRGKVSHEADNPMSGGESFITFPKLKNDEYMVEKTLTVYEGKDWAADDNQPDFEQTEYPNMKRFAHVQRIGKNEKQVFIRTLAGGYIDPHSIILLDKKNMGSTEYTLTKLKNGEYKIDIGIDDTESVLYHTYMPVNWEADAKKITDEDYSKLPREVYEYYTKVEGTNPSEIRFHHPKYPEVETLAQWVDQLKKLKPYDRLMAIHEVIRGMRYTRTERTEQAFAKFIAGQLPEKDFLTFVFNSSELEQPGDGDCDVQNTIFALIARMTGIPTKLLLVITKSGNTHGPASVYLAGIGWVLMDAMGDRELIEKIIEGKFTVPTDTEKPQPEDAVQLLNRKAIDFMEYQKRGCPALIE